MSIPDDSDDNVTCQCSWVENDQTCSVSCLHVRLRVTLLHSIYKAQPVNQDEVVGFINSGGYGGEVRGLSSSFMGVWSQKIFEI